MSYDRWSDILRFDILLRLGGVSSGGDGHWALALRTGQAVEEVESPE